LGSFLAGVKAGTLAGLLYLGGLAFFNVVLLYALKPEVLSAIGQQYSSICTPTATVNSTGIEDCFSSVVAVYVPFDASVGFFVALFYSALFGVYYESFPGRGRWLKGLTAAAIVGLNLVLLGLSGFYFSPESSYATVAFFLVWTLVFGYFVGRLYRKYTRIVQFESQDPESLRILVDRRDFTGKARTFAHTSSHKVRAEVADDASFKEWETTGGVGVEDNRSFETLMEVNGDGVLMARVSKKY
jgi:hypothetical protein